RSIPHQLVGLPPADRPWLQPYPDLLHDQSQDPGDAVVARETIELAFPVATPRVRGGVGAARHVPARRAPSQGRALGDAAAPDLVRGTRGGRRVPRRRRVRAGVETAPLPAHRANRQPAFGVYRGDGADARPRSTWSRSSPAWSRTCTSSSTPSSSRPSASPTGRDDRGRERLHAVSRPAPRGLLQACLPGCAGARAWRGAGSAARFDHGRPPARAGGGVPGGGTPALWVRLDDPDRTASGSPPPQRRPGPACPRRRLASYAARDR